MTWAVGDGHSPAAFLAVRGPGRALAPSPTRLNPAASAAIAASDASGGPASGLFAIASLAATATAVAKVAHRGRASGVRRNAERVPVNTKSGVTTGFDMGEGDRPIGEQDRTNSELNDGSTGNLTKVQWMRRVRRVDARHVVYDVTLLKPLGLLLETYPNRPGIGVKEIFDEGNAAKNNDRVIFSQADGMWILEGDELVAVNDQVCQEADMDDILQLIGNAGSEVTLTFKRNVRGGPIKCVFFPSGAQATVRRNVSLSAAAAYAGLNVKFGCTDGWCGTCWHRERSTNGVMKPCCGMLTSDWDSTLPLVLTLSPEKAGSKGVNRRGQQ